MPDDFLNQFRAAIAAQFETPPPKHGTPGELALAQDHRTIQTPALDLIDTALVNAYHTPDSRLIISMPPQEGKTVRCARDFPLWCLAQNPDLRVIIASYSTALAMENGMAIRNRVARGDLGLQVARDNGSAQKWTIQGHRGGVFSVGIGAGVAGRPADLLIIDDPIRSHKDAYSPAFRERNWNWWTAEASARLAPGAPVIMVTTRWHEDDLAGRFLDRNADAGWRLLNIPAQADHDPGRGETDVLGREPGEFMVSAQRRTRAQWELRKAAAGGSRDWNALYQGRPSAAEGGLFKRTWWKHWDARPYIPDGDGSCTLPGDGWTLAQSWDMAFKDTDGSDYVVGQVWAKRGADAYLLDQYRARASFTETKAAVQRMAKKWPQASTILIEDKANGTAVIDSLRHIVPGIVPVTPHESKEARAAAVTPFIEAGNVHVPLNEPWTEALIEEAAAFPTGAHDDQVDALTQALNRLYINAGQGAAFLGAWRAEAEARGLEVQTHARDWRNNIPKKPEQGA